MIYKYRECTSLKKVELPRYLTALDGSVFQNCSSLVEIVVPAVLHIPRRTSDGSPGCGVRCLTKNLSFCCWERRPWIRNRTCGRCLELIWMRRCSLQRRRHRSRNIRPPAATIRSCASSLKWLAPLRPLPTMANQKKTDYICISKESERPAPDTLDETLPGLTAYRHIHHEFSSNLYK